MKNKKNVDKEFVISIIIGIICAGLIATALFWRAGFSVGILVVVFLAGFLVFGIVQALIYSILRPPDNWM